MSWELFIEETQKEETMTNETIEDLIIKCCSDALSKELFGFYFYIFGKSAGLGKTYERTVKFDMEKNKKKTVFETTINDPMDIILSHNNEKIGLEIKTTDNFKKFIAMNRLSILPKNGETVLSVRYKKYKEKIVDYMEKNKIDKFFMSYTTFIEGKIRLYKIAERNSKGEIVFINDSDKFYRATESQTGFIMDISNIVPIKIENFESMKSKLEKRKKKKTILDSVEQLNLECRNTMLKFKQSDSGPLGKNWGDKGKAFEKIFINHLFQRFRNIKYCKSNSIMDFVVSGLGPIQLKTSSTKSSSFIFCRSSESRDPVNMEVNTTFFDNDEPVIISSDLTKSRGKDVLNRISNALDECKEEKFRLIEANFYNDTSDVYILASKCEDGSIKTKGSFLKDGYYTSKGGENLNQTHFYISKKGLQSEIIDDVFKYCQ